MKKLVFVVSLLFVGILLNIVLGSVWIPLDSIFDVFLGNEINNKAWSNIIINHRIPRVVTTLLVGSSLSLSGLFMQTFFRNPLAGPYVLGISAGASLGIAMIIFSTGLFSILNVDAIAGISLTIGAITGSMLVFLVIIFFSDKVVDHTSLLIIGLMFSSATSALVSILQFFGQAADIQSYLIWTFGDVGSVSYTDLKVLFPIVMIGWIGSFFLVKPLNIYLIGNQYASNSGLNVKLSRYVIISLTALLSGSVTAYCGPIAFVGLAAPHITRMIFDTSNHRKLVPYSAAIGAIVLLFCDVISRLPGSAQSLPLNAVTSILGGPLVIWLIVKKKNMQSSF